MSKKLSPLFQLRNIIKDEAYSQRKYFLGQVLTIIDAAIADPEQRKGIKDLIQNTFWMDKFYDRIREILLEFSEKFCSELTPKPEEKDMFLGRGRLDESMAPPSWFANDNN